MSRPVVVTAQVQLSTSDNQERFPREVAMGWARRLRETVKAERAAGGQRSPEALLRGKGLDCPHRVAQVLGHYERLP